MEKVVFGLCLALIATGWAHEAEHGLAFFTTLVVAEAEHWEIMAGSDHNWEIMFSSDHNTQKQRGTMEKSHLTFFFSLVSLIIDEGFGLITRSKISLSVP